VRRDTTLNTDLVAVSCTTMENLTGPDSSVSPSTPAGNVDERQVIFQLGDNHDHLQITNHQSDGRGVVR
jgi:hypothetical protein